MTYFRKLNSNLEKLNKLFSKNERLLVLLIGDPDAMASAMALKRILGKKVQNVSMAITNEMTRPDNLAMQRYLQIPVQQFTPSMASQFDKFALVDSQPHHNPEFKKLHFSAVIDHHPLSKDNPIDAEFCEIKPEYGANSTIMTEYLYNSNIRPGKLLATALLYGIKTDTHSFEQNFHDADIKAFRHLSKYADHMILRKIVRSEFRVDWLKYFSQAFRKMRLIGEGLTVFMGKVDSTDILVVLADFFLRVHDISWDIVSGVTEDSLVVIFRGDGIKSNMGDLATRLFGEFGYAGGHKSMARAEIPLDKLGDVHPQQFIWEQFQKSRLVRKKLPNNHSALGFREEE
ncbi:MAG: DHH family phosphoesterase [Thermodesulfobacteriota bacterium]